MFVCLGLYRFVHNLALSFFSFMTVMTGCFKRHDLILESMCFTLISPFNLIPSATGMTGRNGRKTERFHRRVRLVVSCPSFLALKYRKFSPFVFLLATVTIHYVGRNVLIMGGFLLSLGLFYVGLHHGAVSVLDLYLVSFSYV